VGVSSNAKWTWDHWPGDPTDLYTIADLSVVWVELAVPTADLDVIAEAQAVVIIVIDDSCNIFAADDHKWLCSWPAGNSPIC
jgi:hypothetical protein